MLKSLRQLSLAPMMALSLILLMGGAAPGPPLSVENPSEAFTQYTFQPGSPFHVLLQHPIRTDIQQLGDPVEAIATQDVYFGSRVVLSKNTRFMGQISILEPPIQGRNAILAVRFDEVLLPTGETLPIQAYVKTENSDHTWGGELTPGTKPKRVTYRIMALGEYNRVTWVGPRMMGSHLEAKTGELWTIILETPLQVTLPNS